MFVVMDVSLKAHVRRPRRARAVVKGRAVDNNLMKQMQAILHQP